MRYVLNMGYDNSGTYISAKTSKKTKIVLMFFLEIVGVVLFLATVGTVAGFLGKLYWILDNFSAFRVQYCFILLAGAVISGVGKRYKMSALSFVFAMLNLVLILPFYFGEDAGHSAQEPLKLMMFNVNTGNSDYDAVLDYVKEVDPDFVALLELNHVWWRNIEPLLERYPYYEKRLHSDNFGVAFLSKYPMNAEVVTGLCNLDVPSIIADVEYDEQELTVITTHPLPPPVSHISLTGTSNLKIWRSWPVQ